MVYTILLYQIDPKSQYLLYDLAEFRNYMYNVYMCVLFYHCSFLCILFKQCIAFTCILREGLKEE